MVVEMGTANIKFDVNTIVCENEDCKMEWILMVVFRTGDKFTYEYNDPMVMGQSGFDYCPLCGYKQGE